MLTAIQIGNFKAFAEPQRIPIRPLTLIYGANSSGKSSILHSLIYSHHAQETGDLDGHLTRLGGESVDLGGFRQFIHQRNSDSRLHIEWETEIPKESKRLTELLPEVKKASIGLNIGFRQRKRDGVSSIDSLASLTPKQILSAFIEEARSKNDQLEVERWEAIRSKAESSLTLEEIQELRRQLQIENFWLDLDGARFLSMSVRPTGHLQVDVFDREHSASRFLIECLVRLYSTSDRVDSTEFEAMAVCIDELIPKISFEVNKLFPVGVPANDKMGKGVRGLSLVTVKQETRQEDLKEVLQMHLQPILGEIIDGVVGLVSGAISRITYLGPLRAYPPRHIGFTQRNGSDCMAGGEYAWETVRKDSAIRHLVNTWLGDKEKLSTSYELKIRYLLPIKSIREKFHDMAARAFKIYYDGEEDTEGPLRDHFGEMEEAIYEIPENLEKLESLFSDIHELVLFDERTGTPVSHRDVGIGISQVLPVLVTCYGSLGKMIAMEQPEIHLHPALQAELGDLFIESALGPRNNTLLIESHSEHLLLRIMRRMRETSNDELPKDIPAVRPEDVCVLFVEPKGSSSVVRHLELDEEGQLLDPWPGGFFEEGYRERFA